MIAKNTIPGSLFLAQVDLPSSSLPGNHFKGSRYIGHYITAHDCKTNGNLPYAQAFTADAAATATTATTTITITTAIAHYHILQKKSSKLCLQVQILQNLLTIQ